MGSSDRVLGLSPGTYELPPTVAKLSSSTHYGSLRSVSPLLPRRRNCVSQRKESHNLSSAQINDRLHFNFLSHSKEIRRVAPYYQSPATQCLHQTETLSDGNSGHCPAIPSPGLVGYNLDLKDAYLHIPIHRDHQRFLQFTYRNITYQFQCLPFGLSTAPRVFTRITKVIVAALRRQHIHLYMYLDDWLIVGPSRTATLQALSKTVQLTQKLGFIINQDKSSLVPTQKPVFLGASLNMTTGRASPSLERCRVLEDCIQLFLSATTLPARAWLRLLGFMASLVDLVPWCRMHMRPLQLHLLYHYRPRRDPISTLVPMDSNIRSHLKWWLSHRNLLCGTVFPRPFPSVTLTTDASKSGWGAHLDDLSLAGLWSPSEQYLHINLLELLAVQKALQSATDRFVLLHHSFDLYCCVIQLICIVASFI